MNHEQLEVCLPTAKSVQLPSYLQLKIELAVEVLTPVATNMLIINMTIPHFLTLQLYEVKCSPDDRNADIRTLNLYNSSNALPLCGESFHTIGCNYFTELVD